MRNFYRKKAVNATKLNPTIDAAVDWLLEHQNDPEIDIPAGEEIKDEDMESSAVEVNIEPLVESNLAVAPAPVGANEANGANGAVAKSMKCNE